MREPWHVRVRGPLAAHAVGFEEHLVGLGYAAPSVDAHRRLVADLSGWLRAAGLGLDALVATRWGFLAARRRAGPFLLPSCPALLARLPGRAGGAAGSAEVTTRLERCWTSTGATWSPSAAWRS